MRLARAARSTPPSLALWKRRVFGQWVGEGGRGTAHRPDPSRMPLNTVNRNSLCGGNNLRCPKYIYNQLAVAKKSQFSLF